MSGWDACHDGSVWAERNGNLFNDAKVALGYTTSTGGLYVGEGNPNTAGGAMQWRTDGCVDNANWAVANSVCSAIVVDSATDRRARLCTVAELTGGSAGSCGTGTGCNHDSDMVRVERVGIVWVRVCVCVCVLFLNKGDVQPYS